MCAVRCGVRQRATFGHSLLVDHDFVQFHLPFLVADCGLCLQAVEWGEVNVSMVLRRCDGNSAEAYRELTILEACVGC